METTISKSNTASSVEIPVALARAIPLVSHLYHSLCFQNHYAELEIKCLGESKRLFGRGGLGNWIGREGLARAGRLHSIQLTRYPSLHPLSPLRLLQRLLTHYSAVFRELKLSSQAASARLNLGSTWAPGGCAPKGYCAKWECRNLGIAGDTQATPSTK